MVTFSDEVVGKFEPVLWNVSVTLKFSLYDGHIELSYMKRKARSLPSGLILS